MMMSVQLLAEAVSWRRAWEEPSYPCTPSQFVGLRVMSVALLQEWTFFQPPGQVINVN